MTASIEPRCEALVGSLEPGEEDRRPACGRPGRFTETEGRILCFPCAEAEMDAHDAGETAYAIINPGKPYPLTLVPERDAARWATRMTSEAYARAPIERLLLLDALLDAFCSECGNDHPRQGRCRCADSR